MAGHRDDPRPSGTTDDPGQAGVTAEVLPVARVQEALDRLAVGDVRHRFVLDTSALA